MKVNAGKNSSWKLCECYIDLGVVTFQTGFDTNGWKKLSGDWTQLVKLKTLDFINLNFIVVELDYDKHGPLFGFTFKVLGIGFYISANPPWKTKQSRKILKYIEKQGRLKPFTTDTTND